MSRQTLVNQFFKAKTNQSAVPMSAQKKKFNLSLCKTPPVQNVLDSSDENCILIEQTVDIISLLSDDESKPSPAKRRPGQSSEDTLDSSADTVSYHLTPPPASHTILPTSDSPKSNKKFYSPTKKHMVRKTVGIKRNLARDVFESQNVELEEDKELIEACLGVDDKTVFFLGMVSKCLKDKKLLRLLDKDSQKVLTSCLSTPKPGASLVSQLYWRQTGWKRKEEIIGIANNKKPLDDPTAELMLKSLVDSNLIEVSGDLDIDEYSKVLKSGEIKEICKHFKIPASTKQDNIERLKKFTRQSGAMSKFIISKSFIKSDFVKRVTDKMKVIAGACYKLSDVARMAFYKLYMLTYLGIDYSVLRDKKLILMLINDKSQRETYPLDTNICLDNASVVFETADEFERYLSAHEEYENFLSINATQDKVSNKERCGIVLKVFHQYSQISDEEMTRYKSYSTWLRKYTPGHIYIRILDQGIMDLKRANCEKLYWLATKILTALIEQNVFRQHSKAAWCAEKALILYKYLKLQDEAAEVLLNAYKSISTDDERVMHLHHRTRKLIKHKALDLNKKLTLKIFLSNDSEPENELYADHIYKLPIDFGNKRGSLMFEMKDRHGTEYLSAEQYCLKHYINSGTFTHGEHWEGKIVTTIFFALFWDIIYCKPRGVNGIYLCRYQRYPLDMFDENFYTNRKLLIDERLDKIHASSSEHLAATVRGIWEQRPECELSGLSRDIGLEKVCMVVRCLGGRNTSALCRRLATDYRYTHSGFPDLTLWNEHHTKIKFVEVKTDSDRPSIKQLSWMHYMKEHDIDCGLCYVGGNTSGCKARSLPPRHLRTELSD